MSSPRRPPGPFEEREWPATLTARVVTPGPAPRLHGYAVAEDLAPHYRFGEVLLLALTGEAPEPEEGALFEHALVCLGAVSVAEAPVHAAVLSRAAGAPSSGTLAVGLLGLTEQARYLVGAHRPLLDALEAAEPGAAPPGGWPAAFLARTGEERAIGESAVARWPVSWPPAPPLGDLAAVAALLVALHACGLTHAWQLEAALVAARVGALAAEAQAAPPGRLTDYPMNLPPFAYEEDEDA